MSIEEYKQALADHDWYYAMSDDSNVWWRGRDVHRALQLQAQTSPEHKALWDKYQTEIGVTLL